MMDSPFSLPPTLFASSWRFITHLFYKKSYEKMSLKNPKNLKKMLAKSPASNAWAALFKNNDFYDSPLKVL